MNFNELERKKNRLFELIKKNPYQIKNAIKFVKQNKQIIYQDKNDEILIKILKERKIVLTYLYVEILKKNDVIIKIGPLMECMRGISDEKIIKFYIKYSKKENGKNFFERSPLFMALECNYSEDIINLFIFEDTDINKKDKRGKSLLLLTLESQNENYSGNFLKSIIDEKTDLNQKNNFGESPLLLALKKEYPEDSIKFLINKKTNINQKNNSDNSPLLLALKKEYSEDLIKSFINKRTDLNQKNNSGYSPLLYSLKKEYPENLVKLLKNEKTDINQKNKNKNSPLIYALKRGYSEKLVKSFINKKTEINQKNIFQESPFFLALKSNYSNTILKLLINKETDINQRNISGESLFDILFKKDSKEKIFKILEIIDNFLDITTVDDIVNIVKLNVDGFNVSFFIKKFPELEKKDFTGWNLFNYLFWNKRIKNLNYLMIFNY